jgi:hypothetical protein
LRARPPLLWLGAAQSVHDVNLTTDGQLRFADGRQMLFSVVDKINTNLSYYDAASKTYF